MCGIVGIVAGIPFSIRGELLTALKRLEYRGYDSVGYATNDGRILKDVGYISDFMEKVNGEATLAIAHTRWSTHGRVTKPNAHPHYSENFMIVHNGIIENYEELKEDLIKKGYNFKSETDSELIAYYFEENTKRDSIEKVIRNFYRDAKGTFAVLLIKKGDDKLYAFKLDSPLVLSSFGNSIYIASDIYAFSDKTNKAIFLDDYEYVIVDKKGFCVYDKAGRKLKKEEKTFEWEQDFNDNKDYEHFMIKEIYEQPLVAERLINSLNSDQKQKIKETADLIKSAKKIIFISAGTSFHASMLGNHLLNQAGIESHSWIASEFDIPKYIDKDCLAICISQSGETMDLIRAVKYLKSKSVKIVSLVNVPYSTLQRLSDLSINLLAGQEVCVAATKSYTNQCIALIALAKELGYELDLEQIPKKIKETIDSNLDKIKELADKLYKEYDVYVLGRGACYSAALEIALKIKEISYIHAEGLRGGELKHGTLALVEDGTPVISLIPLDDLEMKSNTKEVEARGAYSIKIVNKGEGSFVLPESKVSDFIIYSVIIGQLLTYYMAKNKGLPIDKPRNLAKSVTTL